MTGMFDDIFGGGSFRIQPVAPKSEPKKEKIYGKLYLPLEQAAELLKINGVLPAVRKGLGKHL